METPTFLLNSDYTMEVDSFKNFENSQKLFKSASFENVRIIELLALLKMHALFKATSGGGNIGVWIFRENNELHNNESHS